MLRQAPCFGKQLKGKDVEDLPSRIQRKVEIPICSALARPSNDPGRLIAA